MTAIVGAALLAIGALGLSHARSHDTTVSITRTPSAPAPASPLTRAQPAFVLVGSNGRLYPGGGNGTAPIPLGDAPIVGAARGPTGGYWLARTDGRVVGYGIAALGTVHLGANDPRITAIASSPSGGYWLLRSDGHVDAFHAPNYGDLTGLQHARAIGIAAAPNRGYWIATSDGKVWEFGTASRGSIPAGKHADVVGIAASERGYWLATSDGHVYSFGVPAVGDLVSRGIHARVVGIAAAPKGGFWLATSDGRAFSFGAPPISAVVGVRPQRVVAVVPS
ncbi:MAG TPA: hypothetical protein VL856_18985 [Acidimicrobiia bacterium]|jgi:hypothetical protein|nr:hypothetical protein [Acidimicrobiia bacterium]